MLRVLIFSTLFPDASRPNFGVFVERQTLGLAAMPDTEAVVVAPVGLPPFPLSLGPRHRSLRALPAKEDWKGLRVHRPRFTALPGLARSSPARLARKLLPLLRKIRADFPFDVIDTEFFWPDGPAVALIARGLDVPFSIKARGADIQYWGKKPAAHRQIMAAARDAGGMLAVSGALREEMIRLGLPAEKIAVHYTGIDRDRFKPGDRAALKALLGVEGPLLLSVGALIPRKGQLLAIEAAAAIEGATLLIAGAGPERGRLERRIAELKVGERVRLLGGVPHADLPALFAAADLMILPSTSEGLANVWVEALASGTPVITSAIGGADEVVSRPEAGALVARDAGAIAAAAERILASPPSQASVRAVVDQFSWEENARQLRAHLEAIARR